MVNYEYKKIDFSCWPKLDANK